MIAVSVVAHSLVVISVFGAMSRLAPQWSTRVRVRAVARSTSSSTVGTSDEMRSQYVAPTNDVMPRERGAACTSLFGDGSHNRSVRATNPHFPAFSRT